VGFRRLVQWKGPVDVGWDLAVDDTPERRGGGGVHLLGQSGDRGCDVEPLQRFLHGRFADVDGLPLNQNERERRVVELRPEERLNRIGFPRDGRDVRGTTGYRLGSAPEQVGTAVVDEKRLSHIFSTGLGRLNVV